MLFNRGMNKKGFTPIIILIIALASVVALGVWAKSSGSNTFLSGLKAPAGKVEKQTVGEKPTGIQVTPKAPDSLSVQVVKLFCENFFKGPPALNDAGVVQAYGLLSQKAKQSISMKGPGPSAPLVSFTGVTDVPDQGFTINEASETGDKATVKTTWKYSSGPLVKIFTLVKENGSWKIDSLQ